MSFSTPTKRQRETVNCEPKKLRHDPCCCDIPVTVHEEIILPDFFDLRETHMIPYYHAEQMDALWWCASEHAVDATTGEAPSFNMAFACLVTPDFSNLISSNLVVFLDLEIREGSAYADTMLITLEQPYREKGKELARYLNRIHYKKL